MRFDAVFWDFDGVICDSVDVKTRAFAALFEGYGEDIKSKVVEYHIQNGGMSRYEKFKYYYRHLLRKEFTDAEFARLCDDFSALVLKKVIESPYIEGAKETLDLLFKDNTPMYVVSGTPNEEIKIIVKEKNLNHYFIEVLGSPRQKDEIVREILAHKRYNPPNCLFIGDAMSDYNCAKKLNLQFLGIAKDPQNSIFPVGTKVLNSVTLPT